MEKKKVVKPAEKKVEKPVEKKAFAPYRVKVTCTALNIRENPNKESKVVGLLGKDDIAIVLGAERDWGQIDKGWINLKFVVKL